MFTILRRSLTALIILLLWGTGVHGDLGPGDPLQDLQKDLHQLLDTRNEKPEPPQPETRRQALVPGGDHHHVVRQAMLVPLDTPDHGEKIQTAAAHSPEKKNINISARVRYKNLIERWIPALVQNKEVNRGVDVTDFDLINIRLFMSYDEIMQTVHTIKPESKITAVNKEPCVHDRIESINKDRNPNRNCIRKVTIEPIRKIGGSYKIDVFFAEDLPINPGISIAKSMVYMKYFGKKEGDIKSFAETVIQKYGRPVLVGTFNEHFFGHENRHNPRYDLPYLNCCGKIGYPYIISLSAGTRFERHMGKIARQTVNEATPEP